MFAWLIVYAAYLVAPIHQEPTVSGAGLYFVSGLLLLFCLVPYWARRRQYSVTDTLFQPGRCSPIKAASALVSLGVQAPC